ncbi:hypothetical protein E0494_03880 [Marinilabiliaceae bacterium JC040]|nr:hypothetical protein [Marinilabiliaceae bacterium JC040]
MNRHLLILLMILCFSCNKESIEPKVENDQKDPISIRTKSFQSFDWENQEKIYIPALHQSVISPFYGGPSTAPSYIWCNKHPKVDGWILAYNLLDDRKFPFFGLYNRFTGKLRIFIYGLTNANVNHFFATLKIVSGARGTSLLNHENSTYYANDSKHQTKCITKTAISDFIIDGDSNNGIKNVHFPQRSYVSLNWMMFEFELAYDPDINIHNSSDLAVKLFLHGYKKVNIQLSGTQKGSVSGDITTANSGSGGNLFGNLVGTLNIKTNNSHGNKYIYNTVQNAVLRTKKEKPNFFSRIYTTFIDKTPGMIGKAIGAQMTGGVSWIAGKLGRSFIDMIGMNTSTPSKQLVDMKLNSNIKLQGSAEEAYSGLQYFITIPKTGHKDDYHFHGFNNKQIGAWNLDKKPYINMIQTHYRHVGDRGVLLTTGVTIGKYTICNKPKIIINPDIKQYLKSTSIEYTLQDDGLSIDNLYHFTPYYYPTREYDITEFQSNLIKNSPNGFSGYKFYARINIKFDYKGKEFVITKRFPLKVNTKHEYQNQNIAPLPNPGKRTLPDDDIIY